MGSCGCDGGTGPANNQTTALPGAMVAVLTALSPTNIEAAPAGPRLERLRPQGQAVPPWRGNGQWLRMASRACGSPQIATSGVLLPREGDDDDSDAVPWMTAELRDATPAFRDPVVDPEGLLAAMVQRVREQVTGQPPSPDLQSQVKELSTFKGRLSAAMRADSMLRLPWEGPRTLPDRTAPFAAPKGGLDRPALNLSKRLLDGPDVPLDRPTLDLSNRELDGPDLPLGRPTLCTSHTVSPDELPTLAGVQCINLGSATALLGSAWVGLYGSELRAHVPASFRATRSKSEMKSAYLLDWLNTCHTGGASDWSMAADGIKWTSDDVPGLFWDEGKGYYFYALMHAVLTLYGFRAGTRVTEVARDKCHYSAGGIRELVEGGTGVYRKWIKSSADWAPEYTCWIKIDNTGLVTVPALTVEPYSVGPSIFSTAHAAFAYNGRVHLTESRIKLNAALADYYLYWAHRLYSYALDGSGSSYHYMLGELCAKAAMAEIAEIAALLAHEVGHLFGSSYHCDAPAGEDIGIGLGGFVLGYVLAAASGGLVAPFAAGLISSLPGWVLASLTAGGPQDCCQYVAQGSFHGKVRAGLGLPQAHMNYVDVEDSSANRFDRAAGTTFDSEFQGLGDQCAKRSPDYFWNIVIDAFLESDSGGTYSWDYYSGCAEGGLGSDKGSYSW